MSALFTQFEVRPWELLVRTVTIYLAVVILLRIAGKKQLGQMGPTEFVAVLLLSNAVQNAMVGADNTLLGGLLSAAALVVTSRFISWATFKSAWMRTWFEGTPSVLVQNGQVVQASLDRELLTKGDLIKMLRQQGIDRIEEAYLAVLDPEGNLTVARHPATETVSSTTPPTPPAPTSSGLIKS
jgi:uncharacterized membrane protein YcaP (DUF421 family)